MAISATLGTTTFDMPSDKEFVAARAFRAPRKMVFEAWTTPAHLQKWLLGPPGWTMPVCELDLRPGGAWRMVWSSSQGESMEMNGVYLEILPNERLVSTESWGGDWPETRNAVDFGKEPGLTTVTMHILYPSREARDKALATGMSEGMNEAYNRLDEHLKTML